FRIEAEMTARSSSSWTEADIWREATGGPNHGISYGFRSQDQASALSLTLTGTSRRPCSPPPSRPSLSLLRQ
ncbi:hypothetical protein Dimus_024803, partial [Dionaea muscipula]